MFPDKALKIVMAMLLILFASCSYTSDKDRHGNPGQDSGTIVDHNPRGLPEGAVRLGTTTLILEDGTKVDGSLYDTDGDGEADFFLPDAGQSGTSPDGTMSGTTNGTDGYDITWD